MGADPDLIDAYFHYYQGTGLTTDPDSLQALAATADECDPALIVFDSWISFLALSGLDENSSNDVSGWVNSVCKPLKRVDRSILLLDHTPWDGGGVAPKVGV